MLQNYTKRENHFKMETISSSLMIIPGLTMARGEFGFFNFNLTLFWSII